MRKPLLLAFFTISTIACQENKERSNQNNAEITFKNLDVIKSKTEIEIKEFLKKKYYSLLETQFANQWKSKSSDDIIQFNGKGVLFF